MSQSYFGHHLFDSKILSTLSLNAIGVYYCGSLLPNGNLLPLYVGRAIGRDGIKGRITDHLNEKKWSDVTHFGYITCGSDREAMMLEVAEIDKFQPKYNIVGKR